MRFFAASSSTATSDSATDAINASETLIDRLTSDFAMAIYVIALGVIFILMIIKTI